jgi:hypothetical protein
MTPELTSIPIGGKIPPIGNTEGIVRKAYARATTRKVAEILELKKAGGE